MIISQELKKIQRKLALPRLYDMGKTSYGIQKFHGYPTNEEGHYEMTVFPNVIYVTKIEVVMIVDT